MTNRDDIGPVADLDVWQRSMDLVTEVYRLVEQLPARERFGLAEQVRRAVASIPANIAEGNARAHPREYVQFLAIARGSLAETATHIEVARRVGYWSEADLEIAVDLVRRIRQMLNRLIASLSP